MVGFKADMVGEASEVKQTQGKPSRCHPEDHGLTMSPEICLGSGQHGKKGPGGMLQLGPKNGQAHSATEQVQSPEWGQWFVERCEVVKIWRGLRKRMRQVCGMPGDGEGP